MLLLCVSDIHGNLDALRAVLATAEKRAFHKLLVAGDIIFPGPHPLETWRRLTAADFPDSPINTREFFGRPRVRVRRSARLQARLASPTPL